MDPLISVIIPVYNGEKTVRKCLDSVVNQSYKNIEIIVVNDGSKDGTGNILRNYFSKVTINNRVITIPNGGLANARNVGWDAATGDYCINLDADDYLETDILECIFNTIKDDFDVCYYGFRGVDPEGKVLSNYEDRFKYYTSLTGIIAAEKKLNRDIWICQGSAIYKKKTILSNGIKNIPGINQGEDLLFITSALAVSAKVTCVERTGVNIVRSETSMMHSKFNDSFYQSIKAVKHLQSFLESFAAPQLKDYTQIELLNQICRVAKAIIGTDAISFAKKIAMIRELKSNEFKRLNSYKKMINRNKLIEFSIIKYSSVLYYFVSKIYFLSK